MTNQIRDSRSLGARIPYRYVTSYMDVTIIASAILQQARGIPHAKYSVYVTQLYLEECQYKRARARRLGSLIICSDDLNLTYSHEALIG